MGLEIPVGVAVVLCLAAALWIWLRSKRPGVGAPTAETPAPEPAKPESMPPARNESSGLHRRPKKDLAIRPLDDSQADAFDDEDEDEDEITVLRVGVQKGRRSEPPCADAEVFFADVEAEVDVPTGADVTLVTSAIAQTDPGKKRRRNEDRFLQLDSHHVYAVADGIGGYPGGDVAAETAVSTLRDAFLRTRFDAEISGPELPWRAAELVKAVQQANLAIYNRGKTEPWLKNMGTTLVAARFAPRKERLYIAHVGDSRLYRLRDGRLRQLTKDHTYGELGLVGESEGATSGALSRAVGAAPHLTIDVVIAEPRIGDRYLLCSDGLSRMVEEPSIVETMKGAEDLHACAHNLVRLANDRGGVDNVTVIVVDVCSPATFVSRGSRGNRETSRKSDAPRKKKVAGNGR